MTDVVVHHMETGEGARVRCRNAVAALALHDRRLAAVLPGRVALYGLPPGAHRLCRYGPGGRARSVGTSLRCDPRFPLRGGRARFFEFSAVLTRAFPVVKPSETRFR